MAARMFNTGLRVVASKYDDTLLSLENLLCILSHVEILPGAAGNIRSFKKENQQQQHNNLSLGKFDVNELSESVVYSVNPLCEGPSGHGCPDGLYSCVCLKGEN